MRSSTRRTILWATALVIALVAVGLAYLDTGDAPADEAEVPTLDGAVVPDDPGEGCGAAAATDPEDLRIDRTVARCGPGAPEPHPVAGGASVTIAVSDQVVGTAPVLLADALGEFEAEGLDVEIVAMPQAEAYAAMDDGEVDVVAGGVDAPFFDAVHGGLEARLVLGGPVPRDPNDLDVTQAGLWLRADLIGEGGSWENVRTQTVLVPGGPGSSTTYPIGLVLNQEQLSINQIDLVDATATAAAAQLEAAAVGGAWLSEPVATSVADNDELRLVATVPGSESVTGVVCAPDLLAGDRAVGLAVVRAIVRTINTHLADDYSDEAVDALAEALDVDAGQLAAGLPPVFDWEVRAGTTTRVQDSLVTLGSVRYEVPVPERAVVDRSLYGEVVS